MGRVYVRGCGHGCGEQGGRGGRRYSNNPYELASRYGIFVSEARAYPSGQCSILYSQQNNNIQEMKIIEGCRGFGVAIAS